LRCLCIMELPLDSRWCKWWCEFEVFVCIMELPLEDKLRDLR